MTRIERCALPIRFMIQLTVYRLDFAATIKNAVDAIDQEQGIAVKPLPGYQMR